jgi:hypothetical protein
LEGVKMRALLVLALLGFILGSCFGVLATQLDEADRLRLHSEGPSSFHSLLQLPAAPGVFATIVQYGWPLFDPGGRWEADHRWPMILWNGAFYSAVVMLYLPIGRWHSRIRKTAYQR